MDKELLSDILEIISFLLVTRELYGKERLEKLNQKLYYFYTLSIPKEKAIIKFDGIMLLVGVVFFVISKVVKYIEYVHSIGPKLITQSN